MDNIYLVKLCSRTWSLYALHLIAGGVPARVSPLAAAAGCGRTAMGSAVAQLVDMGLQKGRSTKKDLKVGICGEHGGDPSSIDFCHRAGLNYVSCSPFRVPIARLAAAQAALNNNGKKKK